MVIYSDMDGVLADFFGGLETTADVAHWKEIKDIEGALMQLKSTFFFANLDTFDEVTYPLVGHLKEMESRNKFIQWGIISTPLRCDHEHSIEMKKLWLRKNGLMPSKHNLHFLYDKEQLATNRLDGSPNVLIDDKPTNVKKWRDAGGIGLLFQANKDSVDSIKKHIDRIVKDER